MYEHMHTQLLMSLWSPVFVHANIMQCLPSFGRIYKTQVPHVWVRYDHEIFPVKKETLRQLLRALVFPQLSSYTTHICFPFWNLSRKTPIGCFSEITHATEKSFPEIKHVINLSWLHDHRQAHTHAPSQRILMQICSITLLCSWDCHSVWRLFQSLIKLHFILDCNLYSELQQRLLV